ncbi:hypothetical protein [Aquimarina sp. SS2-1]|uniref:hypothetical protein n=1 Tax=Aquimarina besae TaxID=3342247 RepID=UPI00366FB9C0
MNKIKLVLLIFLISQIVVAQRTYTFDYTIGFTRQKSLEDHIAIEVAMINSKNNDYHLLIVNEGNPDLEFHFIDHKIGFETFFYLDKQEFLKANRIDLNCDLVKKIRNPKWNRKQAKKYFFKKLNDTVINDTVYNHILLRERNKKYKSPQKRKWLDMHFITHKDKKLDKPFMPNHYVYLTWEQIDDKEDFNFDVIKEQYALKKGKKQWIYKFFEMKKIENKYISVPEACDFSK